MHYVEKNLQTMPKNALCRKEFTNKDLALQVRTITNEDGSISINAEDTAIGFGWTQVKNGKIYPKWERMNGYLEELGFSPQVGKDDYIPESLFYRLGMKASNKVADAFQNWLAMEVIPSIRKTGSYSTGQAQPKVDTKEKEIEARLINARVRKASMLLKIADKVDNPTYQQIMYSKATEVLNGKPLIPLPKVERKTYSAAEIGEKLGITAHKVGSIANKHNLKTEEYGLMVWDKSQYSNKQVETWRYYENAIPVLKSLMDKEQKGA